MNIENRKDNKSVFLMIIIFVAISVVYNFFLKDNSDIFLNKITEKINIGNNYIILFSVVMIGVLYFIWDGFITKKGHAYPKILEEGRVGKDFAFLNDDEKLKTIKKSKKLLIFGLIFAVAFFFLLEYLLKLYLDF